MKNLIIALLLLASASRAVDTLSIPTNYLTVTTGTRATLAGNFTSIETWGNRVRDSIAQVTARLGGYTGSLAITSLANLRLKLDGDNSETARILVESGSGDSLFTVREDSTAKFYGNLTVNGTTTQTGVATFTAAPVFTALTASLPVFTNGSKAAASNAMTGTGSVVMSTSPTIATPTFTGISNPTGPIHIGTTSSAARAFRISGITLSGDNQYGALISPAFTSASTTQGVTGYFALTTAASAFTMTTGIGVQVDVPSIGAASAITNLYGLKVENQTGGANNWAIKTGTGKVELGDSLVGASSRFTGTIAADSLISSKFYTEGTFTISLLGCTTTPTATARYVRIGKFVHLHIPAPGTCTSNATALQLDGLPAALYTARNQGHEILGGVTDNGTAYEGSVTLVSGSSNITVNRKTALATYTDTFTGSGTKGLNFDFSLDYTLQ